MRGSSWPELAFREGWIFNQNLICSVCIAMVTAAAVLIMVIINMQSLNFRMLYKIYVFLYLNEPTFSCVFSCIYMEKERERDKLRVPEWIKSISVMKVSSHEVQTGLWVRCSGFLEELGESLVREVTWKRQGNFGVGRSRKPGFLELCSPL